MSRKTIQVPPTEASSFTFTAPLPLTTTVDAQAYPVSALPPIIRDAVMEVQAYTKAPVAMVASSALGALSLAIQTHTDIARDSRLKGPVGLFLLTIGESGERKSSCDRYFTQPLRDFQARQIANAKPLKKAYAAEKETWEAKKQGLKDRIKADTKNGKNCQASEDLLMDLESKRPDPPKVPRLLYDDVTTEELRFCLATEWPSAGVISNEAGIVFGSHGMGRDSVMKNLATLNQLWDGADIATDRRTSESFLVRGARLTVALQVQESVLRTFFEQSKDLARGSGFLARFLISVPESTQGTRLYTDSPTCWVNLDSFNQRVTAILDTPAPLNDEGELHPALLMFNAEAKTAWVAFHDRIETELGNGGKFHDVRDVASKTADNAARLATLFHVFQHGISGFVGVDSFVSASKIMEWHLNESRRFLGELALPPGLADAGRLEKWMISRCAKYGPSVNALPVQEIMQYGPYGLRKKEKIQAAVAELEELGRAKQSTFGTRSCVLVNPALFTPALAATANPATPANHLDLGSTNSGNSISSIVTPEVPLLPTWQEFDQRLCDGIPFITPT